MKPQILHGALATLLAVGFLASTEANAGAIIGTAHLSNGSLGTIDLNFTDNTAPVMIDETSTISGGLFGTILGQVKVNGTADGIFNLGVRFGQSTHDHESRFQFSEMITNTGATDQLFSMDFLINAGQLQTTVFETPPQAGEFLEAGYVISISFDGTSLFQSSALLHQVGVPNSSATNASVTLGGTSLGGVLTHPQTGAPDTFLFTWEAFTDTIDLGVLAAGGSGLLEYDVRTFVRAEFTGSGGQTGASIGDPFNISGDPNDNNSSVGGPNSISSTPVTAIPEPTTLALIGLGLAGISAARRRKITR